MRRKGGCRLTATPARALRPVQQLACTGCGSGIVRLNHTCLGAVYIHMPDHLPERINYYVFDWVVTGCLVSWAVVLGLRGTLGVVLCAIRVWGMKSI